MKIDLHCNLPYHPSIPNPVLGYLKAYISNNSNVNVNNVYWNLLPPNIHEKYWTITNKLSEFFNFRKDIYSLLEISKYLYEKKNDELEYSLVSSILNTPLFINDEIEDFSLNLKNYINNKIQQEKLFDSEVAGFTVKTYQWIINYYICLQLKKQNPNIKTIFGGIRSKKQGIEFMRVFKKADFLIWGEGEISIVKLLKNLYDPSSYNDIPNLIYRKNEEIISTDQIKTEILPDINKYPFADHENYFNILEKYRHQSSYRLYPEIPIWGIRSCWWNRCKFCVAAKDSGSSYRERTPENIVAEIEYQSKKYNIDDFRFVDSDVGMKKKESFDELIRLLLKSVENRARPYRIFAEISPLRLSRESIESMNKIRFNDVQIGFEAVTDNLLKKMNKKQSFAHNIQVLKFSNDVNFPIKGLNIIRGIPGEEKKDIIESIDNLKFLRFFLKNYNLSPTMVGLYKGSPYYNEISEIEKENLWDFSYVWDDLKKLDFLKYGDKREFFGFFRKGLKYSFLWDQFEKVLDKYQSLDYNYNWYEYSDGSSFIEEGTLGYVLDQIETRILTFCDTVKTFNQICNFFPEIEKEKLKEILLSLKKVGLIYFDDNFRTLIIAITSIKNKKKF